VNRLLGAYKNDPVGAWIFTLLLVFVGFLLGWAFHP